MRAIYPTELLRLDFTKIEHTFLGKNADSSRHSPLTAGYDLKSAQAV